MITFLMRLLIFLFGSFPILLTGSWHLPRMPLISLYVRLNLILTIRAIITASSLSLPIPFRFLLVVCQMSLMILLMFMFHLPVCPNSLIYLLIAFIYLLSSRCLILIHPSPWLSFQHPSMLSISMFPRLIQIMTQRSLLIVL